MKKFARNLIKYYFVKWSIKCNNNWSKLKKCSWSPVIILQIYPSGNRQQWNWVNFDYQIKNHWSFMGIKSIIPGD